MPPLTRRQRQRGFRYSPWQRFHADEDGKITFVSIFTVLSMIMLTGLIMNTIVSVKEKLEMQNAADVAAYTTNLWRARAMNAITTTNHLMGEATAVLVLLDGFGGRLLESTDGPIQSEEFNNLNRELKDSDDVALDVRALPGINGSESRELKLIAELDKILVKAVVDAMTNDQGRASAGAALYDSRVRLKSLTLQIFLLKKLLNKILTSGLNTIAEFPPTKKFGKPFQYAVVLMHIACSTQLVPLLQEWYTLELIESAIRLIQPAKIASGIESGLLPALTAYTDNLAKSKSGITPWQRGLTSHLEQVKADHRLVAIAIQPDIKELRLPLIQELPPKTEPPSGGSDPSYDVPPRGWQDGFSSKTPLEAMFQKIAKLFEPLQDILDRVHDIVDPLIEGYENAKDAGGALGDLVGSVGDFMGIEKFIDPFKTFFSAINEFKRAKQMEETRNEGSQKNPCINQDSDERYRMEKFYWDDERYSQWTRATYPYVDQHRKKIIKVAKKVVKYSNFATYYVNYTNRYTLYRAYILRKVESEQPEKEKENLGPLKKLLSELASKFDAAIAPTDESLAAEPAPFENFEQTILNQILPTARGLAGNPSVRKWIEKAEKLSDNIQAAGEEAVAKWNEEFDISREDLQALAEQIERINRISELLSLLEELLDQFEIPKPHMWVLQQMEGRNKGNEPWTRDSPLAEKLFSAQATAKRNGQTIFMSPVFFTQHLAGERNTFAQSLLYNANGRNLGGKTSSESEQTRFQPNTGWDTLNWEVPVQTLEWGQVNIDVPYSSDSKLSWGSLLTPRS
jgi:hypothetical protein